MKRSLPLAMALALAAPLVSGLALDTLAAGAPAGRTAWESHEGARVDKLDDENLPDGDDPVLYVLPTFGVAFEYEGQTWTIEDEVAAANNNGRDIVQLRGDQVGAVLYVEATDEMTEADDCRDVMYDEMLGLVGDDYDISDIDIDLSEVPNSASAGFVADPEDIVEDDPRSIAAVIECREFENGEGVVAFSLLVNESELEDALEILEPLRESVEFDVDPDEATAGTDDEREEDDDASHETATFEGTTFDFTYTYDPTVWEIVDHETTTREDWVMFGGPHGSNLGLSVQETRVSPQRCVDGFAEDFRELTPDIELYEDPESGETIESSGETEAYALYTLTDEERGPLFAYFHCAESPDGDAMIVLSGLAPQDELEFVIDEMMPVVDRIEF